MHTPPLTPSLKPLSTHRAAMHFAAALGSPDPEDPLIALADPAFDSRIAIVNPGALDLACALIRSGYQTASVVRLDDRMPGHQADVVIIPHPVAVEFLGRAIPFVRRLLAPLGIVAMRLPDAAGYGTPDWLQRQLLAAGFVAVRLRMVRGDTLLSAELPLHGRLACA